MCAGGGCGGGAGHRARAHGRRRRPASRRGSAFARRQVFLPPYDTATTLLFLSRLIARSSPRVVVALGDSFHDAGAVARMAPRDRATLAKLRKGATGYGSRETMTRRAACRSRRRILRRDAGGVPDLAPCADAGRGGGRNRRAFAPGRPCRFELRIGAAALFRRRRRALRPAGFRGLCRGLNILDPAVAALFPSGASLAHVLGRGRVFRVPLSACAAKSRRERTAGR